jgi:GNAT superfamily N-acetyltransferase
MTEVTLERHSGAQMLARLDAFADLYDEIHSEDPTETDPMFSRPSFVARTTQQAQEPGFELVTARTGDVLAGFSFGYPFPAGRWWADCPPPPSDVLSARKFAVIELDVRKTHRGQGLSKILLTELLAGRTEEYAILAATPGSQAHAMYLRWGWYTAGQFETPPVMDAMVLPLPH